MAGEKSGVSYYTKAKVTITVNFPEKDIVCSQCPFARQIKELGKVWCDILGEYEGNMSVTDAKSGIHFKCPLQFEGAE